MGQVYPIIDLFSIHTFRPIINNQPIHHGQADNFNRPAKVGSVGSLQYFEKSGWPIYPNQPTFSKN